jgi:hypothetical protein
MYQRLKLFLKYILNICESKIQDESLEEPLLKYCENDDTNTYLLQKSDELQRLNHIYSIIEEHV